MENYIIVKILIMIVALGGAFTILSLRVKKLYRLMMSVSGKTEFVLDRIGERIMVLFTDILGQSNVRRKFMPGMAHTLIFFGFIAVQPHSLELMIRGVFPGFEVGHWIPSIYNAYLYVADILACFVLAGFAVALYRRLVIRPAYLTMGRDANLIILFTCVIIITFLLINAFQVILPYQSTGYNYEGVFPVSGALVAALGLKTLSPLAIFVSYEILYYIHIFTILGFLIYIPGSKHLHLLAAVPNVFLKPLDKEKSIEKTDIEDENAETFGLGKVSELNWKNVLNLYSCTECGRCEDLCPAAGTGKPLSPKKWVHDLKDDLISQSELIRSGKHEEVLPLVRENSPITSDVIWSCTTCRSCEDICPVNIEHLDPMFEIRKHRILMESDFPAEMQETFTNLENQSNPWGFGADSRADWCKDMDVPLMSDNPEAELLYFVGCSGSFDDRGKKISQAMVRVLQKAGVNFAILGPEEGCNGDMARRAGNEYLAQMLIQTNVEVLGQYKPKKILAGCPHCFNMIKNEYPQFGASYDVVHHSEYVNQLIQQQRLKINQNSLGDITYHDSCYLGRWNNIYQAPREILKSINGNGKLLEMERNESKGFC
ncbi:MAG: 4Fe-4S dicluster domain-containing protein, partial [Deltaproteobacteria bacterium]|nr:4Fe-4S dicluster domain-containing protein [Deltaproteobacteria bacterium]